MGTRGHWGWPPHPRGSFQLWGQLSGEVQIFAPSCCVALDKLPYLSEPPVVMTAPGPPWMVRAQQMSADGVPGHRGRGF